MTTVVTKNCEPLLERHVLALSGWHKGTRRDADADSNLRVGAGVGHGQEERLVVGELEVLIGELLAVDGLATGALQGSC